MKTWGLEGKGITKLFPRFRRTGWNFFFESVESDPQIGQLKHLVLRWDPTASNRDNEKGNQMKPTDMLKAEHRAIERMLTVMEHAVANAEQGNNVKPEVFDDALKFIQTFADGCHHRKEEALLFPAMEMVGRSVEFSGGSVKF